MYAHCKLSTHLHNCRQTGHEVTHLCSASAPTDRCLRMHISDKLATRRVYSANTTVGGVAVIGSLLLRGAVWWSTSAELKHSARAVRAAAAGALQPTSEFSAHIFAVLLYT